MIKVAMMVGSLRKESLTLKLGEFLKNRYSDKLDVEIVNIDVPLYNGDIDNDADRPASVTTLFNQVKDADAVFMVTPEYNNSTSGVLKNAIDWVSRSPYLNNKPGLIAAQSMGMTGGARGYLALHEILNRIPMMLLPGNDILLPASHTKFAEDGSINDEGTVKFIDGVIENFITYYNKVK
ncbi:NAD(P)H-dependent oxidoreductase [Erysipelothrix sp. HDW6C]|uniref:NADPH-dependent FMN reductase n=1 Tax=Erysipelothrix sp. HDW6C TaxID=2714930 RepID=UPI00140DA6C7|nr:NAD(P)H-dependent oxidoreductase [Erysipelothrix sp. HDW6C]QIK70779.1 NAD(P)H-dependent oxidoreductase [Erysipelothrix sp. HDW6C]